MKTGFGGESYLTRKESVCINGTCWFPCVKAYCSFLTTKNVYFKNQKLIIIKMNKASNKQALSSLDRGVDVPQTSFLCTFVGCLATAMLRHVGPPSSQTMGGPGTCGSMACADDTDSICQCPDTESLNHVPLSFVGKNKPR